MRKVKNSEFLRRTKGELKKLIDQLNNYFDYVSILRTDIQGYKYEYSGQSSSLGESMWTDRGFVVRVYSAGKVLEYSFNNINPGDAKLLAGEILLFSEKALRSNYNLYTLPDEEDVISSFSDEVKEDPTAATPDQIFFYLKELFKKTIKAGESVFNVRVVYEWVKVSKIFLSVKKDLEQNYLWSQAYLIPMVKENKAVKTIHVAASGIGGVEILKRLEEKVSKTVKDAESLLSAELLVPGEYEVICTPDITGLIAHEAFGHGVEMDMFVKNRALGKDFIGKQVSSPLINMRDTAFPVRHAGSFRFDDEGNFAKNTLIIENGILKKGISDLLSASYLGVSSTGNGRRESYLNKIYTRMSNTYFESGNDDVSLMIASVKMGYLLDYTESGMEDPKNWGLQGIAILGKEIVNGKLTGKVVSPVVMTGYVPDILKNITMVSSEIELSGSGYCGKGWKEFVKVSSGGPYIKTKMRLG